MKIRRKTGYDESNVLKTKGRCLPLEAFDEGTSIANTSR